MLNVEEKKNYFLPTTILFQVANFIDSQALRHCAQNIDNVSPLVEVTTLLVTGGCNEPSSKLLSEDISFDIKNFAMLMSFERSNKVTRQIDNT